MMTYSNTRVANRLIATQVQIEHDSTFHFFLIFFTKRRKQFFIHFLMNSHGKNPVVIYLIYRISAFKDKDVCSHLSC